MEIPQNILWKDSFSMKCRTLVHLSMHWSMVALNKQAMVEEPKKMIYFFGEVVYSMISKKILRI